MKRLIILLSICLAPAIFLDADAQVKVYVDSMTVNYLDEGAMADDKLMVVAKEAYDTLGLDRKNDILDAVADDFPASEVVVVRRDYTREIWRKGPDGSLVYLDEWNMDNPRIKDFGPLQLDRSGNRRLFWYAGGSMTVTEGIFNLLASFRAGTFLYRDIIDFSVLANMGISSNDTSTNFNGDFGLMGRVYYPIRSLKAFPMAPYAGIGTTMTYSPSFNLELVFYAGVSMYVGPGSIDVGVQYGLSSKFAATFGYTFRPNLNHWFKKK